MKEKPKAPAAHQSTPVENQTNPGGNNQNPVAHQTTPVENQANLGGKSNQPRWKYNPDGKPGELRWQTIPTSVEN